MASRALATHNGPPKTSGSTGAPNQTLYLTNLPERLQKQDLRLSLYTLFSTYGPVLDVVAMKTAKMRGQAHVVYRDSQTSMQAMRSLQGFDFFGKEMKIQYGKGKSDTIAKLDGTYRMPDAAANATTSTELQKSIFDAPPSAAVAALPAKVEPKPAPIAETAGANGTAGDGDGPQGLKRRREEESEDEGAPMEEDSDVSMEASSEED
ncbi:U2 snRNP complex subunit msl1 [Loxospora ochrophaea]|nr:U2 snRNP complex subunit msl1 [Loxospora ochrophaea]